MRQQLTTRFDRPKAEARAKSIKHGTDLTMSDINRAALNIGFSELECSKADDPNEFKKFVLENQEVKL